MPHPLIQILGDALGRLVPGGGGTPSASAPEFELDAAERTSFVGRWETSFGPMELSVRGDEVQGWYGSHQQWCQLWGSAREGRLEFHYREASESGSGTFTLSPDGRHFEGTFLASGQVIRRPWAGRRLRPHRPFDGLWDTSCGMLRLVREGDSVRGLLQGNLRHARVAGTVDGMVCTLAGAFDGGAAFTAELSADGADKFDGTRSRVPQDGDVQGPLRFAGARTRSTLGQRWLVVLEPHWERRLADTEFSFGDMLRPFFQRIRPVRFRHRRVHSREDFLRHCSDVAFLPDDVVLYISSHGTSAGVAVPDGVVTATDIAAALGDAANVQLLHFGGCNIAAGSLPEDIVSAQPARCRFPVSGFCRFADWSGSAIVDFTYLTLVLERRLAPVDAVAATRSELRFAGSALNPGEGKIFPMDLRIVGS